MQFTAVVREMDALQDRFEPQVLEALSPEQREELVQKPPFRVRFKFSGGVSITGRRNSF